MKTFRPQWPFAILTALAVLFQLGCEKPSSGQIVPTPRPDDAPVSESYEVFASKTSSNSKSNSTLSRSLGLSRFFLIEQPSAGVSKSLLEAFKNDPPGGIVFWNSSRVGSKELSETISRYSRVLKESGHESAFFSIDYEGGGLSMSPSGNSIAGIQRFREGFTDLAHGIWLGKAMAKYGTELCALHGRIMGIELVAAGVNYPLTLVADLAQRLFTVRGVSVSAEQVASCLSTFTEAMAAAGPVVAVTKHYPGLGQNNGDTHDVESVSVAKTRADSERHLRPFRDLVSFVNRRGLSSRLSIMSSHGKFPFLDADHLTTESKVLLTDILRDEFKFQGVRVSDAMWMGGYGELQGDALYAVYANAFLSGLDLLMIPGSRYGGALRAFSQIAEGKVTPEFMNAIEQRSGLSYAEFEAQFLNRVKESRRRISDTLKTLPYPHEVVSLSRPRDLTVRERARYYEILKSIDERWIPQLPSAIN